MAVHGSLTPLVKVRFLAALPSCTTEKEKQVGILGLICVILGVICFIAAAFGVSASRVNLVAAGLALVFLPQALTALATVLS